MKTKQALRNKILSLFQNYSYQERAEKEEVIFYRILRKIETLGLKNIACFVGTKNEVQTQKFLKTFLEKGYRVFLPKILPEEKMSFGEIQSLGELQTGKYGILEPQENTILYPDIDIFLIPGLAFTKDGKRLGKGKGYYDRFLSQERYKNIPKIGICYDFQIVEDMNTDEWDINMDGIISN